MKNKITKPSAKIATLQLSAYGGKLHILDKPLQNNKKTDGFILITPNKDVIPLNNTLQINSSGNPITVVDEDNPDVIIKKENNPNDSSNGTTPDSTPIINE